jgi:hypothetical protein
MNASDFYLVLNEQEAGPYTLEQVRSMWTSGAVTLNTHYWREGMAEWEPLRTIVASLQPPWWMRIACSIRSLSLRTWAKARSDFVPGIVAWLQPKARLVRFYSLRIWAEVLSVFIAGIAPRIQALESRLPSLIFGPEDSESAEPKATVSEQRRVNIAGDALSRSGTPHTFPVVRVAGGVCVVLVIICMSVGLSSHSGNSSGSSSGDSSAGSSFWGSSRSARFQSNLDDFIKEGSILNSYSEQGVNYQTFGDQLARTRAAFDLAKQEWSPQDSAEAYTHFSNALCGWLATYTLWHRKVSGHDYLDYSGNDLSLLNFVLVTIKMPEQPEDLYKKESIAKVIRLALTYSGDEFEKGRSQVSNK